MILIKKAEITTTQGFNHDEDFICRPIMLIQDQISINGKRLLQADLKFYIPGQRTPFEIQFSQPGQAIFKQEYPPEAMGDPELIKTVYSNIVLKFKSIWPTAEFEIDLTK